MVTLDDILEIENDPAILDYRCQGTGIPLWPVIRMHFIRLIITRHLQFQTPLTGQRKRPPLAGTAATLLQATLQNRRNPPQPARALLWATGAGRADYQGVSTNRYTSHFIQALNDDTWSIEGIPNLSAGPIRQPHLSLSSPTLARIALQTGLAARLRHQPHRTADNLLHFVEERANRLLGYRPEASESLWLRRFSTAQLLAIPLRRRYYHDLFKRVQPTLILNEEGCYGHMAVFNACAHERGIPVAEFQHGMISRGHDAYNFGQQLLAGNRIAPWLPDALLTYGEWWGNQINAPVSKVVIGNPWRTETVHVRRSDINGTHVLVLGQGFDTELYLDFCRRLAPTLPRGLELVFRPHPLERSSLATLDTSQSKSVTIDVDPDIYRSFSNAYAVIGEFSTGLFDAVGFAERIFVWDTNKSRFNLPDHPFERFSDEQELADKLGLSPPVEQQLPTEAIWCSDWKARFQRFTDNPQGQMTP
ncbi:hypothetical protein OL229_22265 [Neisseriaceae bacterium JH1-16]|nr:hypothetical protein [Neisseriaceae bacterium JH1-16]